jgi:predicted RNase H-like HicB family nuclease
MVLKYPVILYRSLEDDGYIAIAFDLSGCSAYGDTPELALGNICTAIDLWLEAAQKEGRKIPAPEKSIKGIRASGTKKKAIKPRGKNLHKPLVIDFNGIKTK